MNYELFMMTVRPGPGLKNKTKDEKTEKASATGGCCW